MLVNETQKFLGEQLDTSPVTKGPIDCQTVRFNEAARQSQNLAR